MIVLKVDGRAELSLSAEDCAMLAQACNSAIGPGGLFGEESNVVQRQALASLEAAFTALAVSCAAAASMTGPCARDWRSILAELGLVHLAA